MSVVAITVLWPSPVAYPIEGRAIDVCRAIARRIRAEMDWILGDGGEGSKGAYEAAGRSRTRGSRRWTSFFSPPPTARPGSAPKPGPRSGSSTSCAGERRRPEIGSAGTTSGSPGSNRL